MLVMWVAVANLARFFLYRKHTNSHCIECQHIFWKTIKAGLAAGAIEYTVL